MIRMQQPTLDNSRGSEYWMRSLSFAGLHRMVKAVATYPNGLRAGEINKLVVYNGILLTQSRSRPAPSTLYHYRNTLLRLCIFKREGKRLYVNKDDPDVRELLRIPVPANGNQPLSEAARAPFASLVLKNRQCRSLFFDLFMPLDAGLYSVSGFHQDSTPVKWTRNRSPHAKEVVFHNDETGAVRRCNSPVSVNAILYGLRYWARDDLKLIDEYCQRGDDSTIMFPLSPHSQAVYEHESPVMQTVLFLLALRTQNEWTSFSIYDLITRCCEARKQPISVLYKALDWLLQAWPHHTVLTPTSRALATLTATSPQREALALRRYYKASDGPYISHIGIHKDITVNPTEFTDNGA